MLQCARYVLTFASLVTPDNRSANTSSKEHGSLKIAIAVGGNHRGIAAVYRGAEYAATSHVAGYVKARIVLFGALLAVAQAVSHDELRIFCMQGFPVETHFLQGFRTGVGQEYVGIGKELVHNLSARFALQVQRDESLIQVAHIESEVLFVRHGHVEYRRLGYAQRITLGCLDFNDVGAPFAQYTTGRRRCHVRSKIDNLDSLKWFHWISFPPPRAAFSRKHCTHSAPGAHTAPGESQTNESIIG